MTSGSILQQPLKPRIFWPALAVMATVFIISLILLVSEAWRSNIGALGVLVLIVLSGFALVTILASTDIIPPDGMTWQHLRRPRTLGVLGSLIMGAFSVLFAYLPLLADKGGLDSAIGEMRGALAKIVDDTAATRKAVNDIDTGLKIRGIVAGKPTLVEQRINGIWGQGDCANTYRFTLAPAGEQSRALTVKSLRSAPGLDPYRGQFAYLTANDHFGGDGFARSTLYTEEIEGTHKSSVVDFTLERSGEVEKLLWRSKNEKQNQIELVRCRKWEK